MSKGVLLGPKTAQKIMDFVGSSPENLGKNKIDGLNPGNTSTTIFFW